MCAEIAPHHLHERALDYLSQLEDSFSHLSAALGIKTITLMADTPLIYGNYSSKMYPIIPDGEDTVSHNTLGKERINSQKILNKILNKLKELTKFESGFKLNNSLKFRPLRCF